MDPMAQRFEPVLWALNDAGVRYLVVGGVAVVLHGQDVAVLEAIQQGDDGE